MLIAEGAFVWPLLPDNSLPTGLTPQPTDDQWTAAQQGAIEWLWGQSGRQFGQSPVVYRPQGLYVDGTAYFDRLPYLQSIYGPLWGDSGWPFSEDPRSGDLTQQQFLQLPGPAAGPVIAEITDTSLISTTLSTDGDNPALRLDGNYLVRTDGGTFPTTQDMISNVGAANTWAVSYLRGALVPPGGQVAARLLAVEWLKSILGIKDCKLPWNTQVATRSGVSVQLQLANAYRISGIAAVDRWVTAVNPAGLTQPPRIWSPDIQRNAQPYRGSGMFPRVGVPGSGGYPEIDAGGP